MTDKASNSSNNIASRRTTTKTNNMAESRCNFMTKFTDANMSALKHLTSQQFFEVWNNYDQDGKCLKER